RQILGCRRRPKAASRPRRGRFSAGSKPSRDPVRASGLRLLRPELGRNRRARPGEPARGLIHRVLEGHRKAGADQNDWTRMATRAVGRPASRMALMTVSPIFSIHSVVFMVFMVLVPVPE